MDSAKEIRDRTFLFGCDVARLVLNLAPTPGIRVLIDQLLRAGTVVGANLEEARIYEVLGVGDSERSASWSQKPIR